MAIKNIIFDLGGVLLNLDPDRTGAAFRALVGSHDRHQEAFVKLQQAFIFEDFETGDIHEDEFIKALQDVNPNPVTRGQIEIAWSAMLLNFPAERIELLTDLRKAGYKIYLLSNINSLHLRDVRIILKEELGIADFDSYFDHAYYSHLIGHRKPNRSAFDYVLNHAKINAAESLFIDDNAPNLVGAREAGIHTIHHKSNSNINKRLKAYLLL